MALGSNKRILMIGGEGVVLYTHTGKSVQRETAIAWDVPQFDRQLTETLAETRAGAAVTILFDGADQTYRKEENIPRLSPFDRPRFVRRKLELAFPSYPIRASLEIRPRKGADGAAALPSYLFAALPETEYLDRVGAALFESGAAVSGFGLLPVESTGLVTELAQKTFGKTRRARWTVLVGQHETGGLRQIVTKDGNLALTRLTPTSDAGTGGAGWAAEVVAGFRETLAYVSRFGFTPDEGIDLMVICGDVERQFFDPAQLPVGHFRCLTPQEALALVGARSYRLDKNNFADALHAAWAGRKNTLRLPVRVPSIHRIMAPRLGAKIAGFVLLVTALGCAGYTADRYQEYRSLRDEMDIKTNQVQMMQREYDEESRAFDALPVKPDVIRNTLAIKALLESNTIPPGPVLEKFKAALGGDIVLDELEYAHTPGKGLQLDAGGSAGPEDADPQDRGRIRMSFKFTLPETMPLEQKVSRAEALQASLQAAFPGWRVDISSQFGRVERGGMFQGVVGGDGAETPAGDDFARFEMEGAPS